MDSDDRAGWEAAGGSASALGEIVGAHWQDTKQKRASPGVGRDKSILKPKLGIAARYEFLGAFLCLSVVGAFHIDGVRNMDLLVKQIDSMMRHIVLTSRSLKREPSRLARSG